MTPDALSLPWRHTTMTEAKVHATTVWDIKDRCPVTMPVSHGSSSAAMQLALRNMPAAERARWERCVTTLNNMDYIIARGIDYV